jgi:predicted transcriptional regulator
MLNAQTQLDEAKKSNRIGLDIVAEIIRKCSGQPQRKTRLMFQANLSYHLLEKYLSITTKADLVRKDNTGMFYIASPKGNTFLKLYDELRDLEKERREKRGILRALVNGHNNVQSLLTAEALFELSLPA